MLSYNRYAYAWNNPVNRVDPTGYSSEGNSEAENDYGDEEAVGLGEVDDNVNGADGQVGTDGKGSVSQDEFVADELDHAFYDELEALKDEAREQGFSEEQIQQMFDEEQLTLGNYASIFTSIFGKGKVNLGKTTDNLVSKAKEIIDKAKSLFSNAKQQGRNLIGLPNPTKKGAGNKPQPYDKKSGRYLSPDSNPGPVHSPAGRFASGFAQGYAEGKSGVSGGATPVGLAGDLGYAAGQAASAVGSFFGF